MFKEYAYLQAEASECGLACLAASAAILGDRSDLASLRRRFPVARGLSLKDIHEIASAIGLNARSVRCELSEVQDLSLPAILHFGLRHFVVLERVRSDRFHIFDPATGRRAVKTAEMSRLFSGVATEVAPTPTFEKRRQPAPLRLMSLIRITPQLLSGLLQVVLLSVFLEIYVLASPYYIQLSIDEAATKGDTNLVLTLAVGFGLFALFNVVATALRALALQKVNAMLNWEMSQGLFHHLIRLPLPWFQRRRMADVLSRFQSLDPVKSLVSNGIITAVLDGLLSVGTGVMLFLYSPTLALIVLFSLLAYIIIRLIGIPLLRSFASKALVATVREQGKRIETLRSMQTIKSMGGEVDRESDWANTFADTIRTSQRTGAATIGFSALHDLFNGLANITVVALAATYIARGSMSVGMLYAFMSYQTQFLARGSSLFEQIVSWRMLDLYTFRLSDIAMTPIEEGIDQSPDGLPFVSGGLVFKGVTFAYAQGERPILRDVSFEVCPGEYVAIVGPSGCGKSTLLKILTGLYQPSSGEVKLDGLPLTYWGPKALRRSMGIVMQDDRLLSGTIADNVSFFDHAPDHDRVWECLEMAAIDGEVRRMPMRVETFVGDMGSSLSGGQKQRLLLARALYRRPRLLILDEATSHLDVVSERRINDTLSRLAITRVIVAHRPETIASAERVIRMERGTIVESTKEIIPGLRALES